MIRFIDREYEISLLEEEWKKDGAHFTIIYGRRRIGKTALITEFIKDKKGIFYIAEDVNKKVQINDFKEKIAHFLNDDLLRNLEIKEWKDLFSYLEKTVSKDSEIHITIDEFSYLIKNDPALTSALQKFWDSYLKDTGIFLLISGSIFGLMSEKVLSSPSPLYGRRTRDILLRELSFRNASKFLKMSFEEKLKTYMATGGVPEYLLKARNYSNSKEFFEKEFTCKDGYFYREPYYLLSQEFKEIRTYFTILNAIAYGNTKPSEIANFAGIKTREIYPYFDNLIRLNFIEKVTPLAASNKAGIYLIKDVFLDFWFNFVYKNREDIERNQFKFTEKHLNTFLGKRFEVLARDELIADLLEAAKIGRWWYKDKEIDIVGLNEDKKEISFFECKWKDLTYNQSLKLIEELKEKTPNVKWHNKQRKEYYGLIAKKIENKNILRKDGFLIYDLDDF